MFIRSSFTNLPTYINTRTSPLIFKSLTDFATKLDKDKVYPGLLILFRKSVHDVFTRKNKGAENTILPKLNSYHPKVKFTVERNLKLELKEGQYINNPLSDTFSQTPCWQPWKGALKTRACSTPPIIRKTSPNTLENFSNTS